MLKLKSINCGDAATLRTVFEFMYNGYMSDQKHIKDNRLPQLMACADYLQVTGVTEACKVLLNELSARNDVGFLAFVFNLQSLAVLTYFLSLQSTFDQLLSWYKAAATYPGYTDYLVPIFHRLKEHAGENVQKKARVTKVLKQNEKFVDPSQLLLMVA